MERNVEKVISDLRFARSKSNVDVPKESKKLTPWRFQTIISLRIESTMRSVTCSAESMGRTKYATIVAVKLLMETEGEEDRERIGRKKV